MNVDDDDEFPVDNDDEFPVDNDDDDDEVAVDDEGDDDEDDDGTTPKRQNQMLNKPRRRKLKRRLSSLIKDTSTTWKAKKNWPQLDFFLLVVNEYLPNEGGKQQLPGKRAIPQSLVMARDGGAVKRLRLSLNNWQDWSCFVDPNDFMQELNNVTND